MVLFIKKIEQESNCLNFIGGICVFGENAVHQFWYKSD